MMDNTIELTPTDLMLLGGVTAHLKLCQYEPKRDAPKMRFVENAAKCMSPQGQLFLERELPHLLENLA